MGLQLILHFSFLHYDSLLHDQISKTKTVDAWQRMEIIAALVFNQKFKRKFFMKN